MPSSDWTEVTHFREQILQSIQIQYPVPCTTVLMNFLHFLKAVYDHILHSCINIMLYHPQTVPIIIHIAVLKGVTYGIWVSDCDVILAGLKQTPDLPLSPLQGWGTWTYTPLLGYFWILLLFLPPETQDFKLVKNGEIIIKVRQVMSQKIKHRKWWELTPKIKAV